MKRCINDALDVLDAASAEDSFHKLTQLKQSAAKKARLELVQIQTSQTRRYTCTYQGCDKSYTKPSKLADHLRSHSGERPYCCSEPGCSKRFLRKSHLQAHAPSHLPKDSRPYACDEDGCLQRFSTNQHLRQHMELHTRPRPYSCETCGESFHKNYQCKRHVADVHTHGKPCLCPQPGCGKSFTYASKLEHHLTHVHDPTKRYACEMGDCGRAATTDDSIPSQQQPKFSKWSHLQAHIKQHHKLHCLHCGKQYSESSALKVHVETHEVPLLERLKFPCSECDKAFTRANALKKHVAFVHEGIREFKCAECGKEFAHKRTLKSHIVREHRDNDEQKKHSINVTSDGDNDDDDEQSPHAGKRRKDTRGVSLMDKLTGAAYESSGRDIACIKTDCAHRFTREYDFDRHIAACHPELEITVEELLKKRKL